MNDRRLCQRDSGAMRDFMEQSRLDAAEVFRFASEHSFYNYQLQVENSA